MVAALILGACSFSGPKVTFNLPNTNGTQFNSEVDAKKQPVLLFVMGTHCGYCRASIPTVNELNAVYGPQGLKVVAILADRQAEPLIEYAKENKIAFDVLYNGGELMNVLKVQGVPNFFLLNRNHEIVRVWQGMTPADGFAEHIRKVL